MVARKCLRFSEHFNLGKPQHELDFVDILLTADLPVYLDPYAFKVGSSDFAVECNNLVVDYFDTILDCIRTGRDTCGRNLLNNLKEPNETRLGVSRDEPHGRGVGHSQAGSVYDRLAESKAAKSGLLRDLSDCELLIPGISQDKISDITTNIVRGELAEFTTRQCRLHNVPTQCVRRGVAWSEEMHNWIDDYAELPLYLDSPIILVPKSAVRRRIAVDHEEYYSRFALEFLQKEHLRTGSSLVEVLKSGKRRVTKKKVKENNPFENKKDWLREFSEKYPEIFRKYRDYLNTKLSPIPAGELENLIRYVQNQHGGGFIVAGDLVMGDKNTVNGNVNAGVVGSGSINARDIAVYCNAVNNSGLTPDVKKVLVDARQAVEDANLTQTDKADVCDSLGRLATELDKPTPEPGLIRRYFNRIKDVAAGVGAVLATAKTIMEFVQGG